MRQQSTVLSSSQGSLPVLMDLLDKPHPKPISHCTGIPACITRCSASKQGWRMPARTDVNLFCRKTVLGWAVCFASRSLRAGCLCNADCRTAGVFPGKEVSWEVLLQSTLQLRYYGPDPLVTSTPLTPLELLVSVSTHGDHGPCLSQTENKATVALYLNRIK